MLMFKVPHNILINKASLDILSDIIISVGNKLLFVILNPFEYVYIPLCIKSIL